MWLARLLELFGQAFHLKLGIINRAIFFQYSVYTLQFSVELNMFR
jgi:hypothetical protein